MAIKVIGTGASRMLTVRFRPCERELLVDELHHHRAVRTEATAEAHAQSSAPGAGAGGQDVEHHHAALSVIARLLDDLNAPAPDGRPQEIVAPSWVLGPVSRGAAVDAVERLGDAVRKFAQKDGGCTPEEVRRAVDAAAVLTATLIGLDHAENFAVAT